MSERACWDAVDRFREAVLVHYHDEVKLPTAAEKAETARYIHMKYGLPGFAYGVDGMLARMECAPRGLPEGPGLPNQQSFWTRKMCHAINCMVIGDDRHLIRFLDRDWHGSAHDARVWNQSAIKPIIEQDREFLLAGDSAYPLSEVLIKPYSNAESLDDPRKALFNHRLSGARSEMTENLFGRWVRRFPFVKQIRTHIRNSQRSISCCAVLHNWAENLRDVPVDDGDIPVPPDDSDEEDEDVGHFHIVADCADRNISRRRGQERRVNLLKIIFN